MFKVNSDGFKTLYTLYDNSTPSTEDNANIWSVGAGYNFDGNWDLFGAYANNTSADNYETAHTVQLKYKGARCCCTAHQRPLRPRQLLLLIEVKRTTFPLLRNQKGAPARERLFRARIFLAQAGIRRVKRESLLNECFWEISWERRPPL